MYNNMKLHWFVLNDRKVLVDSSSSPFHLLHKMKKLKHMILVYYSVYHSINAINSLKQNNFQDCWPHSNRDLLIYKLHAINGFVLSVDRACAVGRSLVGAIIDRLHYANNKHKLSCHWLIDKWL